MFAGAQPGRHRGLKGAEVEARLLQVGFFFHHWMMSDYAESKDGTTGCFPGVAVGAISSMPCKKGESLADPPAEDLSEEGAHSQRSQ